MRETLHQAVQLTELLAAWAALVGADRQQALADGGGQLGMRRLLEAPGVLAEALAGQRQFGHVVTVPGTALQALPDFQHMAGLMHHALGEVLLEAVAVGVFVSGHDPARVEGRRRPGGAGVSAPLRWFADNRRL